MSFPTEHSPADANGLPVALTRTPRGWSVVSPAGGEHVADLVEGLSLADLVAEEFGALPEPDRTARRSARGPGGVVDVPDDDPVDARVAALERTVAQLEHALAARVSTERAIGVLAERHGTSPRAAFETLRRDARSQGRPVAELAREVLDGLRDDTARPDDAGAGAPELPAVTPLPRPGSVDAPSSVAAESRP
ncbi:MAG: ANTAR domain-containing protein [Blastococcus sp.]